MTCRDAIAAALDAARTCAADFSSEYRTVEVVVRTWSGSEPGLGTVTEEATTLVPKPRVQNRGPAYSATSAGRREMGQRRVSGVSLTYAKTDLAPAVAENQEVFYRIDGEAYRLSSVPVDETTGWTFYLDRMTARPA